MNFQHGWGFSEKMEIMWLCFLRLYQCGVNFQKTNSMGFCWHGNHGSTGIKSIVGYRICAEGAVLTRIQSALSLRAHLAGRKMIENSACKGDKVVVFHRGDPSIYVTEGRGDHCQGSPVRSKRRRGTVFEPAVPNGTKSVTDKTFWLLIKTGKLDNKSLLPKISQQQTIE